MYFICRWNADDLDLAPIEEDKTGRTPGADILDYFNYGFIEGFLNSFEGNFQL